jgi:CRP/FNR family cyclic AMP-dependent transcriptional regulator
MAGTKELGERFVNLEGVTLLGEASHCLERINEIIDHIPLFEGFSADDVKGVVRQMQCYRVPAGCEIIQEGESGEFMLLLLEGNIEIVRRGRSGLPQRISVVVPGETLGEMSLVDGEPRFASCVSINPVSFAVLDRMGLENIFQNEPHLGIKMLRELLKLLNQRLRDTGQRLVEACDAA